MSPIYTGSGDEGITGLLGKDRVPKDHPRIEAIGDLDEASASIGLARAHNRSKRIQTFLKEIQEDLYTIMAEMAATSENEVHFRLLGEDRIHWLESKIETISSRITMPRGFILPGDTTAGAALSLARTVVRRAERHTVKLVIDNVITSTVILPYLNRLSTLLFVLELEANSRREKSSKK